MQNPGFICWRKYRFAINHGLSHTGGSTPEGRARAIGIHIEERCLERGLDERPDR